LEAARFERGGIPFDRRFALLDPDPLRAGKPLTGRKQHRLLAYRAAVRDDAVYVRTPSGAEHEASGGAWLRELEADLGQRPVLHSGDEPVHDAADILVLNAASLRAFSVEYGGFVNPIRFRPNVIVDGRDANAFEELAWPGCEIAVGHAVLRASKTCERCVLTTVDPETLAVDPQVLKLVVQRHDALFGVYCTVVRAGDVRVGDDWTVSADSEVSA